MGFPPHFLVCTNFPSSVSPNSSRVAIPTSIVHHIFVVFGVVLASNRSEVKNEVVILVNVVLMSYWGPNLALPASAKVKKIAAHLLSI